MVNKFNFLLEKINESSLVKLLLLFIAWRIFLYGLFYIISTKIGQNLIPGQLGFPIDYFFPLQGTVKWDGYLYLKIATEGYGNEPSFYFAFFPLFPLLVYLISSLGIDPLVSGALINTAASFITCYYLFLLAREHFNEEKTAFKVLFIFIFFPFSYFLFAFYTEALFCSLAFSAFYYARKRKWLISTIILAFITSSRVPGLVVCLGVFSEYLNSIDFNWKKLDKKVFYFALAPIGILSYMLFLHLNYNDPILFLHAYDFNWSHFEFEPNIFKTAFLQFKGIIIPGASETGTAKLTNNEIPFLFWLLFLVITLFGIKKIPISYTVFSLGTIVLIALNSHFISVNRYVIPLFPVYLITAGFFKRVTEEYFNIFIAFSSMALIFLTVIFVMGYWTG